VEDIYQTNKTVHYEEILTENGFILSVRDNTTKNISIKRLKIQKHSKSIEVGKKKGNCKKVLFEKKKTVKKCINSKKR
jgi:hypothetical protein